MNSFIRVSGKSTLRGSYQFVALYVGLMLIGFMRFTVEAARISEPDTTFYGKVVQRLNGREFMVTTGELVWKITTSGPGAGEYRFTAQLQPLGGDRYSYQLRVPHQLLAYDFSVAPDVLPIAASGARVQTIMASLNGQALVVTPQVVAEIILAPERRASAYRVDLQFEATPVDSDGDGLPDWWEDAHGLDKWDATDAGEETEGGGNAGSRAQNARTFAEWRAALFPNQTGDLRAFGELDSDGDGISNLLEYAFGLDPRQAESNPTALPSMVRGPNGPELAFRRRPVASDIEFQIDLSTNLIDWTEHTAEMQLTSESTTGQTTVRQIDSGSLPPRGYFRVRILYTPTP